MIISDKILYFKKKVLSEKYFFKLGLCLKCHLKIAVLSFLKNHIIFLSISAVEHRSHHLLVFTKCLKVMVNRRLNIQKQVQAFRVVREGFYKG